MKQTSTIQLKLFILVFILSLIIKAATSQPLWVHQMQKDNTNYFKTVKHFERYWEHHFKPNEEEEEYSSNEKKQVREEEDLDPRRFIVKLFKSEEEGKEKSNKLLIYYKNFNKWQLEMLPYVKSNGSIMTPDERIAAWKQLNKL